MMSSLAPPSSFNISSRNSGVASSCMITIGFAQMLFGTCALDSAACVVCGGDGRQHPGVYIVFCDEFILWMPI